MNQNDRVNRYNAAMEYASQTNENKRRQTLFAGFVVGRDYEDDVEKSLPLDNLWADFKGIFR